MPTPTHRSFAELVDRSASAFGGAVFLPRRHPHGGEPVTFDRLRDDVRALAAALLALGVRPGDHVGLVAENRYEWLLCDLACAYIGAVDVPRGTDTAAAEIAFILGHAGCRFVFVENQATARAVLDRKAEIPRLETVCVMVGPGGPGLLELDRLLEEGRARLAADPHALETTSAAIGADDLLTIVYTSGTTANPKGVMLTHGNVLSNIAMVEETLHFGREDVALSVLPSWHSYERIMDYAVLYAGAQLVYSDRRRIKEDLRGVQPTIFAAVPRIWEMLHDGIVNHCRKQKGAKGRLLGFLIENCRAVGGRRAGPVRRVAHGVLRRSVLPKLLAATGGRLRIAVSGGGALPAHVDECLLGMGIPILNGYGLTETSPVASVRRPHDNRPGTIGPPMPGTAIEIRDEQGRPLPAGQVGLIWIRGPQVMRGYYRNADGTAAVLADGWFNSGDLGCLEADGHVRITGRAKDTIVLSGGENVEPERIETAIKTSPFIEQAVVVGQDQKVLGALLVPDFEALEAEIPRSEWDARDGALHGSRVRELLRKELDRLITRDNGFRPIERIATFAVMTEPLTTENGLLTQTLKVRRHVVHERHGGAIAALFR